MTDETMKNEETRKTNPGPHVLTVLVDLSNPVFACRGIRARLALAETLSGLAREVLRGSEATIVTDADQKPLGVCMIAPDETGEGREAFNMAVQAISSTMKEVGETIVAVG